MKYALKNYGKPNRLMRYIVLICWICADMQLPAQILSFETEVIEAESFDGIYKNLIQSHDSGFLFLTSSQVAKIDKKGKVLWQYEFKDGRNPLPRYPFYPSVGRIFDDKEGIYLFGEYSAVPII